ncbi:MAG: glycosyltransferase family 4 protein [Desulfobacterales bacterium]|jgi:colanic acid biosynthesis glycosyl transferase WcaI|nr:glycosyltransferase family 4 protein [Desulfobacterales bacterium]
MTDKAKILIISGHYYPDYGPATPIFTTMAEDLAARSHDVTVVTTFPHYSQRTQIEAKCPALFAEERRNGVRIIRTWVYSAPKRSLWRRMVYHLMLNLFAAAAVVRVGRPDVIIAGGPFLWCSLPLLVKACGRVPFIYLVYDIYPDILIRLNILHHPAAIAVIDRIEKFFYKQSFRVSVLSEGFKRNLIAKGVPPDKISVIPVCVDTDFIRPLPKDPELAARFGVEHKRVVLYAGNIGFSQGLDNLLDAARRLAHRPDIVFLIIGEGAMREPLERRAKELELTNCIFADFVRPEQVPRSYSLGDIGLVSLKRDIVVESVPSKTYSIMAAGLPIVATIDPHSEIGQLIRRADCGVCLEPENPEALAQGILDLVDHPDLRHRLGHNGRDYVVAHFHRRVAADHYEQIIDAAKRPSSPSVGQVAR